MGVFVKEFSSYFRENPSLEVGWNTLLQHASFH